MAAQKTKKPRPTYGSAVAWIALNDGAADDEGADQLASYISVVLVADLFGMPAKRVGLDVYSARHALYGVKLFRILRAHLTSTGMSDAEARDYLERGFK